MSNSPSQTTPAGISSLIAQGKERLELGDHTGARNLLTTAVEEADKTEQRVAMGRSSSQSAGLCLLRMGRAKESLVHLQQAIAPSVFADTVASDGDGVDAERMTDLETAQTLHCMGMAHASLHEHHEAVGYFKKSLALFKKHRQTTVEARGLLRLAASYVEIPCRVETAVKCFDRAEALYVRAQKPDWQAYVQALRASLLLEMGEREEAAVKLELATILVQSSEDPKLKCRVFSSAGQTYSAMGRYSVSVVCFKQALRMARQTAGNLQQEATLLANIGAVLTVEESHKEAITFHQKAVAAFERLGHRSSLASTLANFGRTLLSVNQLDAAMATVQHAVNVARQGGDIATAARCAETLAGVHALRGDVVEERRCLRAALKSLAHLTEDVSSDVDRVVDKLRALDLSETGGDGGGTALGQSQVSNLSTVLRNIGGGTEMLEGTVATQLIVSPTVKSLGSLSSDSSISVSDIEDFFDVSSELSDSDADTTVAVARVIATKRKTSNDRRQVTPSNDSPDADRRDLAVPGNSSADRTPVATAQAVSAVTRSRKPAARAAETTTTTPSTGTKSGSPQQQPASNKPSALDLSGISTSTRPRPASARHKPSTRRGSQDSDSPHIAHRRMPPDAGNSQLLANMAHMGAQPETPELGRTLSGLGVLPTGGLVLEGGVLSDSPLQSPGGRRVRQRRSSSVPGKSSSVCVIL